MAKRIKNKRLDPGRYGMTLCPECKGKGKFLEQDEKVIVCSLSTYAEGHGALPVDECVKRSRLFMRS